MKRERAFERLQGGPGGLDRWNRWRNRGEPAPDLHHGNFREADLAHAVLRSANLREANLKEADLSAADLAHARIRDPSLYAVRYDESTRSPDAGAFPIAPKNSRPRRGRVEPEMS